MKLFKLIIVVVFSCSSISAHNNLPKDISCLIADIKFDGKKCKILEFGEITKSYFKGHEILYGTGKIWQTFWQHLAHYKLQVWYLGRELVTQQEQETVQFKKFLQAGGRYASTFDLLKQHKAFKSDVESIIIQRKYKAPERIARSFKQRNPQAILLNQASRAFVSNKLKTSKLFDEEFLEEYKPQWKHYEKHYSKTLATKIAHDFPNHETLVIKPLNSANGFGVIITTKQNLDRTLKRIFSKKYKGKRNKAERYWKNDTNRLFLVESFERSKYLTIKNKHYDPTLRVIFVIDNYFGPIQINYLGSYWKLPMYALEDEGTLTEKHKSKISLGNACSVQVSDEDFEAVTQHLDVVLPIIYEKMLRSAENALYSSTN